MHLSKYVSKRSLPDDCSLGSLQGSRGLRSLAIALLLLVLSTAGLLPGTDHAFAQNSTIFGPNVYVFTPSDSASSINATLNTLNTNAQFSTNRYAVLFQPGTYTGVEAEVGYYESVAGLGQEPTAVTISNGYLTSNQTDSNGNLTTNFWRSIENMSMTLPAGDVEQWGVSQGAAFRRMNINDSVELTNTNCGEASGGFIADSVITGNIQSCSQQQWYTRNSNFAGWTGNLWNMTFSGDNGAPAAAWGGGGNNYCVLAATPVVREKPFLYVDSSGNYWVFSPSLRSQSVGPSWTSTSMGPGTSLAISTFYIATPSSTLAQINSALASGQNLILTPGIYQYSGSINITNPNTVVLGLGYANLVPQSGTAAISIADVGGVQIAGLLIDAGPTNSPVLFQVGTAGASRVSHASNPTSISDVFFRIGGAVQGTATESMEIDSDNVILDNIWAWRADHGQVATGWTVNVGVNGLVVNGDYVTALGLAVEHYEGAQVQWNGQGGETIFYQSEMPYDVPSQAAWMDGTIDGYASYNVSPTVTTHQAYGLGVYSFFNQGVDIIANSGILAPVAGGVTFNDSVSVYLAGSGQINYNLASDSPTVENAGTTAESGSFISFVSSWGGTVGNCAAAPSIPGAATATAQSITSIKLSWVASSAGSACTVSYNVYRSTTSGFTPSASNLIASNLTSDSYLDNGLTASTTYYYVVQAADGAGTSVASNQASTETLSGGGSCSAVPSAPMGVTATATSSSAIGLSWSADTPPANCSLSGYSVYGSTTSGFTPGSTNLLASGVTGTTYANIGLSASTTYYYKVEATDAEGTSAASTQQSAETQAAASGSEIVAIAAGGPAESNSGGGDDSFLADEDFSGGGDNAVVTATINLTQPGANAAPMAVYQHGRSGVFTYTIPRLTAGNQYSVLLHFAETYFSSKGSREFNVAINGTTVLTNLDVYATVGQNAALLESFTATANSSGQIVIAFTSGTANQPLVMGIEIRGGSAGSCSAVPSAPTGLTATASSSSAIGLSWSSVTPPANCTVSGYSVYGSITNGFTPGSTNLIASGLTGTTYTDTGLAASTTYYYKVEATDAEGTSAASTQASNTTLAASCSAVPSAPTGVMATATSSSAIGVSWSAVTPPANCTLSGYSVYGSTTSGFTPGSTNLIASGLTGTTYANTGLSASTNYYYKVEATDTEGTSAASTQQSAETQAASSSVGYVSIDAGGAAASNANGGDNSFVADEDYSTGGTTHSVTNSITIPTSLATSAAPAAVYQSSRQGAVTYTLPGLVAGTNYIVRLHFAELYFTAAGDRQFNVAINGSTVLTNFDIYATAGAAYTAVVEQYTVAANSSGDIVVSFSDGAHDQPAINGLEVLDATPCTTVPSAPTGLTATALYPSVMALSWSTDTPPANCTISSYNVYGGTSPNPTTLIASGVRGTSYSNTGLSATTTYYYVVTALDASGTSAASNQASNTTPAYTTIDPPTSVTAAGSSSQQIDLRWVASTTPAPNTAPVSYSIYRSTTSPFTPSSSNLMGTTLGITNYVDNNYPATLTAGESSIPPGPGVQPSTTYYYMVVASTLSGISSAVETSATSLPTAPSPAAPAALTGLTAMTQNANEIDLIWNSTDSGVGTVVTEYNIYRSTVPAFAPSAGNLIGRTKSNWFQDVLCTASTQYYYQVVATNSIGTSPTSSTVNATTPALSANLWGGAPFWDASNIPALPAGDTVMMKFLNRTNGVYTDSQITWSATLNGASTSNTFAEQPTFALPPNSSGRMYFYLNDPSLTLDNTDYWDYIEFTAGPTSINIDTTRVDALGLKIAINLTCSDGTNIAVGENQQTFMEDRSVTFQRYLNAMPYNLNGTAPYNFQTDETMHAPYRIIEPGAAGFNAGGPYQNYYSNYISNIWSFNGITIPLAGPNGSNLGANPDLSAAIFRHTAPISGTPEFNAAGTLTNQGMWGNPASFYQQEPYDHYAQWIEAQAINMQQYAFPYNDAGFYSSDISCSGPRTLLVAIGW